MDAVANMVQQGQAAASGATQITLEKHKINFLTQYGTFEDKPSQNIVRWLRKADKYKNTHMIPSLEMGSIVIHCIRGEPAIKVKRMLDVPGLNYVNAGPLLCTTSTGGTGIHAIPRKSRSNSIPTRDPVPSNVANGTRSTS